MASVEPSKDPITITLDANGGKFSDGSTTFSVTIYSFADDIKNHCKTDPLRKGYSFLGWNMNKSATTGKPSSSSFMSAGAAENYSILYAIWQKMGDGTVNIKAGDILNYDYTGAVQTVILPKGTYKLECWGAMGGYRSRDSYAGKGGYSVGTLTIPSPTTLYIYAGGAGNTGTATNSIYSGGFNGGGYRYQYHGGGGASDIRIGKDDLYARVIVAGGGGSDGATNKHGMYGGGTSGGDATENYGSYGYGGTQTGFTSSVTPLKTQPTTNSSSNYPGRFGFGGFGIYRSSGYDGAGGGGWYGGCGSYPDSSGDDDCGGGGGSGYIYTASTASNYPSGCLLNESYYLSDASMIAGNTSMTSPTGSSETGHSGDGFVRITVINCVVESEAKFLVKSEGAFCESQKVYAKIDGSWCEVTKRYVKTADGWVQ